MRRGLRRGFTLLETIVGISIGVALLAAIAVFVMNLADARARLALFAARIECAEAVFDTCERALATAVVEAPGGGAGIAGTERALRIARCGVGLGEEGLLGDSESVEVSFDGASSVTVSRDGQGETLAAEVRAMRVRYLAEDGWVDAFDSARDGAFPAAIEISLWFGRAAFEDAEAEAGVAEEDTRIGAPDRRRMFRIPGAPRVDPLAARAIREESVR